MKTKSGSTGLQLQGVPIYGEHADNPVDWYEWGTEALQIAKDENKPLIISVGYSSCHWCHAMEEESFVDTPVAGFMRSCQRNGADEDRSVMART